MYRDRIVRGAALLDEKKPGWRGVINLGTLELSSDRRCVLGQVLGNYSNYGQLGIAYDCLSGHGFDLEDTDIAVLDKCVSHEDVYADLTREWCEYIASTRTEAA